MGSRQELLECAISTWYNKFSDITFKSILIPVPQNVSDWLVEDGLYIPEGNNAFPTRGKTEEIVTEDDYQEWTSEDEDEDEEQGAGGRQTSPADFPDVVAAIAQGIEELGGKVAPKFTWSCPKDALWMKGNTLQCINADEVLLLLKSSDRVSHDICHALEDVSAAAPSNEPRPESSTSQLILDQGAPASPSPSESPSYHVLALRKWYDLLPGREFRCFVKDHKLLGVSQRDVTQRFDFLQGELPDLKQRIAAFHDGHIAGKFPLRCFAYDCYVPSARTAPVRLVDFNPAGGTTAPLLFDWDEVLQPDNQAASTAPQPDFELRIITEDVPLRPGAAVYGVPFDFVDTSEGSALSKLLGQSGDAAAGLWESIQKQTQGAGGLT